MSEAPNEFYCAPVLFRVPPREPFPEGFHGQPALYLQMIHLDPDASGLVEPLRELGEPILDVVAPVRYTDLQAGTSVGLPNGQRYYSMAHDLNHLSEGAINTVLDHVSDLQGEFTIVYVNSNGGAIAAVDNEATAFGSRTAAYGFHCIAGWTDPADDEQVMSWAAKLHEEMAVHATGGVYLLLIADDEPERIPSSTEPTTPDSSNSRSSGIRKTCSSPTTTSHRTHDRRTLGSTVNAPGSSVPGP